MHKILFMSSVIPRFLRVHQIGAGSVKTTYEKLSRFNVCRYFCTLNVWFLHTVVRLAVRENIIALLSLLACK